MMLDPDPANAYRLIHNHCRGCRVDVTSEAGSRFDQNITGFRAEELFGFNAEPHVRTGRFQNVLGC
jgi:hypothetical protein